MSHFLIFNAENTGILRRRILIQVLYSSSTNDEAIAVSDLAYSVGMGDDGNLFVYNDDAQQWQFNLKTKNFVSPGTYTIKMLSGDEDEYVVESCHTEFVVK